MDLELPEEAKAFASSVRQALAALGGVDVARRAEADPAVRLNEVKPVLDELGVPDIDPTGNPASVPVAAELCRIAGSYVLPFPVVGYVMATREGVPRALASAPPSRCDHADLFPDWEVCELSGASWTARPERRLTGLRLAPFVGGLLASERRSVGAEAPAALLHVLWASYVLGTVEHALEAAIDHVQERVQFGQPLAAFQDVQFRIADATASVDGLRELTRFAAWRVATRRPAMAADALGAHLHAVDTAQGVLRLTQQLHGAAGMCDEYDISILVRHVQPALRLVDSADHLAERLFEVIQAQGFDSLFPHGADAAGGRR